MDKGKTHYRRVLKSNHLGVADIEDFKEEGRTLTFTIREVKQEYGVMVAGKKGDYNIAYFFEDIKPLVLNATNAKRIKAFCNGSPFVEDWKNVRIALEIDESVKMAGMITGGVRIKTRQPKEKPLAPLKPISPASFEKALLAYKKGTYTIEQIESMCKLTKEQKAKLNE